MIPRRTYVFSALALAAVLFVGLNIFVDTAITNARLDLTQTGEFTVSPGTRHILANLQEPVTLKFYYSREVGARYAGIAAYAKRVRDLLQEYVGLSHGKVILEEIDPEPFTPEEDQASGAGLTPAPAEGGDVVYFGLSGSNSIDGRQNIAFFSSDRENYLEYDLTSLIYHLATPKKPKLALITSLPVMGSPENPQPLAAYAGLAQEYDVTNLSSDFTGIPPGTDLLVIAHPPELSPQMLLSIDNFVLKGGRALIFVDPLSELAQRANPQGAAPASDLGPLLKSWGVDYPSNMVLLDGGLAQEVAASNDPREPAVPYPLWLHLTQADFDLHDPITASLQSLNLASAGEIAPMRGATTIFHTLVGSSDQANMVNREQVMALRDPTHLAEAVRPTGVRYALAARITGVAKTAFPKAPGAVQSGHVQLVIMSDSDLWDDRFWVHISSQLGRTVAEPFADNGAFILNAVENLTGSDDLISLRTRASNDRPFTVVQALQQKAQMKYRETQDALQTSLSRAEATLSQLQQGSGNSLVLNQKERDEIESLRRGMALTRRELRDVQRNLRAEVDALGARLAFINIFGVPILVAAFAVVLGLIRRRRMKRPA